MVQNLGKSSLTQFGVIPKETPDQEGYVLSPESLFTPSKPPTERTLEDQSFCLVHKQLHPEDPREWIDITSGSFSLHAPQLKEHENLARKTAAAFSNALSIVYSRIHVHVQSTRDL